MPRSERTTALRGALSPASWRRATARSLRPRNSSRRAAFERASAVPAVSRRRVTACVRRRRSRTEAPVPPRGGYGNPASRPPAGLIAAETSTIARLRFASVEGDGPTPPEIDAAMRAAIREPARRDIDISAYPNSPLRFGLCCRFAVHILRQPKLPRFDLRAPPRRSGNRESSPPGATEQLSSLEQPSRRVHLHLDGDSVLALRRPQRL